MDDTVTITATALRLLVRAGFEVLAAQEAELEALEAEEGDGPESAEWLEGKAGFEALIAAVTVAKTLLNEAEEQHRIDITPLAIAVLKSPEFDVRVRAALDALPDQEN